MITISGVATQDICIGAYCHKVGTKVTVKIPEEKLDIISECLKDITIHNSKIKEVEEKSIILKEKEEILEGENDGNIYNIEKPIKQVNRKSTKKIEG